MSSRLEARASIRVSIRRAFWTSGLDSSHLNIQKELVTAYKRGEDAWKITHRQLNQSLIGSDPYSCFPTKWQAHLAVPRIAGFGDFVAELACASLALLAPPVSPPRLSSVLLNCITVLMDKLIDQTSWGARRYDPWLKGGVRALLHCADGGGRGFLSKLNEGPCPDGLLTLLVEHYAISLSKIPKVGIRVEVYAQLLEFLDDLMTAETELREVPFDDHTDLPRVCMLQEQKSVLPILVLALNAQLFSSGSLSPDWRDLNDPFWTLGALVRRIDDLADVVDDIEAGRWNSCFLSDDQLISTVRCNHCGLAVCRKKMLDSFLSSNGVDVVLEKLLFLLAKVGSTLEEERGIENARLRILAWTAAWLQISDH